MKNSKISLISRIIFHVTLVIFAIMSIGGPMLLANAGIINSTLGIETEKGSGLSSNVYYDTQFKTMAEVKAASLKVIEETMAEGAVLLKNDNSALPLAKNDTVNMYGFASHFTVHTGQGSSGSEGALGDRVSLYEGLKNAGLTMNEALNEWYKAQKDTDFVSSGNFIGAMGQETQFVVTEKGFSALPEAKNNKATAAVIVLARTSGEAEDLYMDTTMDDGNTRVIVSKGKAAANNHNNPAGSVGDALRLSANEADILKNLKTLKQNGTIDKIIVLMNSASPFECDFLEDSAYDIDACMWIGLVGTNGANAVGKLLTGEYNPSGKTSDTFWEESKYNPVYYNFGSMQYGNASALSDRYFATMEYQNHQYYVAYQEGIYNGYKYTETRYEDYVLGRANTGNFNYSDVVTYPFGYGLSYSTFEYSNMKVTENAKNNTYTVTVDVTNTSKIDGKEAVQVYVQKPYTAKDIVSGVEKASVELVGFTKVEVKAGQTVTASIEVEEKYFAAYDANKEKTYVIGTDGDEKYLLTAARDAHAAVNNFIDYKKNNGETVDSTKLFAINGDNGDGSLVWGKHIAYDNKKYSTNAFIKEENKNFTAQYNGQKANYGVNKITNRFDDTDFKKAGLFETKETDQKYMTRSDWTGTYGKRITLTASSKLAEAQKNPAVEKDKIAYPTYEEDGFYEGADTFDDIKLIYLKGKDYNDPLWDTLLNKMSYEETCTLLQTGWRVTNAVPSVAAPSTSQQNGALAPNHSRTYSQFAVQSGFKGFARQKDSDNEGQKPAVFVSNGIVSSTYNIDLIERVGVQTGEEAAWAGYNGIYGLGVNIHRGAYCGRTFEYYSEDGYLTGIAAGYEAVGMHKLGVFVLMKHAVLNDQETHRAGLNVWANEQTIREVYSRALEVSIEIERENIKTPMLGVMTGMNRLGAKWTGGQGFCNTVLRAEYGMRGYVVSDYNSSRPYMNPVQGVLYGNDLPDGNPAGAKNGKDYDGNDIRFTSYASGYGELAWNMRLASKNILYTVVNSNAMNGIDGDFTSETITPAWEIAVPVITRVSLVIFVWAAAFYGVVTIVSILKSIFRPQ